MKECKVKNVKCKVVELFSVSDKRAFHRFTLYTLNFTLAFAIANASALPLTWRADWPDAKPVETLVHRGTDIELQPTWFINKDAADTNGWTFTTFCQTNAVGPWFGPLPGAFFSHTNDIGAAFYNVIVRAQTPGGAVNYTAFARLRMLDSPGFSPGELPLPVATIDFSKVVALNAPWLLPSATNDIATIKVDLADVTTDLANNYYTIEETDEAIDSLAAYYISSDAQGAAFATYAALTNATVYYSGGVIRVPTRNDYAVVLADESHGGAEWRYIYTVAEGATSGQWDAQYPIDTNDYDGLSNKPQINGVSLSGNKTGADLGVLDLSGGTMTGTLAVNTSQGYYSVQLGGPTHSGYGYGDGVWWSDADDTLGASCGIYCGSLMGDLKIVSSGRTISLPDAAGTLALTSDIAAAISPTSPEFSNAVLSVGLGIDTNTVAVINELVDSAHDLPVTGATTVGALLLALAAAIAALKRDKADASDLPYAISESIALTVASGAASTTLDDRTHNVRTVAAPGSGNTTTITATLPPIVAGKSRDMFLNLTVGSAASDAGDISLSIVEPSGATVQIDIGSVEDIGIGKNEILISENALPTTSDNTTTTHWLVTVRHEDFT